jgi:putative sterol carrier protein
MEPFSDDWVAALNDAAASVEVDPEVELSIDYRAGDRAYRLVIAGGRVRATTDHEGTADLRITAEPAVAAAITAGDRSALEAFMSGEVVVGGDLRNVMRHQELLEGLGVLFTPAGSAD